MLSLETERLIIRDHLIEDLEGLHELLSDADNTYFIQDLRTKTMDETRENLFEAIKQSTLDDRRKVFLAILEKSSGKYVGEIGYTITVKSCEGDVAELGYFILKEFWGKGYVSEAARAVLDYAFDEGGIVKIETGCNAENVGSEKIMIKLGMTREAVFLKHSELDGKLCDRVCYRMLKQEWGNKC